MLDVDVNYRVYVNYERQQSEHNSGISFPVICKEYWEPALSQAQQDHERQQRKRSVSPMKPHIVLSVLGVKSASKPRALTENTPNSWEMWNTFL